MNLMPFKCKTDEDKKCKYECDYKNYGHMPYCYIPLLERNNRYNIGEPLMDVIDQDKILEEYIKMKKSG